MLFRSAEIADEYAFRYPNIIRVIHQNNKGHGGAINTGLAYATAPYIKVVDSDDWVDEKSYLSILEKLEELLKKNQKVDLFISNYVYEKVGVKQKKIIRYRNVLPVNRIFDWSKVRRFHKGQYILMHSAIYRKEILQKAKLTLPEHTFYVDNLFVYCPMPFVETMYYMDVDFYRYFIGREIGRAHV